MKAEFCKFISVEEALENDKIVKSVEGFSLFEEVLGEHAILIIKRDGKIEWIDENPSNFGYHKATLTSKADYLIQNYGDRIPIDTDIVFEYVFFNRTHYSGYTGESFRLCNISSIFRNIVNPMGVSAKLSDIMDSLWQPRASSSYSMYNFLNRNYDLNPPSSSNISRNFNNWGGFVLRYHESTGFPTFIRLSSAGESK